MSYKITFNENKAPHFNKLLKIKFLFSDINVRAFNMTIFNADLNSLLRDLVAFMFCFEQLIDIDQQNNQKKSVIESANQDESISYNDTTNLDQD